jgi:hypothetical protein
MKKKYIALCILTIIIFAALNISTATFETATDGNDTYGFPLTFLTRLGGKRFPNPAYGTEISYLNLLIDLAVAFLLAIIARAIYTKLRKTSREKTTAT